jgi:hypothetical protein
LGCFHGGVNCRSTIFLNQRSSKNVKDQVSHPYRTTVKIIVLSQGIIITAVFPSQFRTRVAFGNTRLSVQRRRVN